MYPHVSHQNIRVKFVKIYLQKRSVIVLDVIICKLYYTEETIELLNNCILLKSIAFYK